MKINIYESPDLIKDLTQENIWILDLGRGDIPAGVHYDEVVSASFYPTRTKVPAMLGKIARYVKETTGREWNWDYTVYVKELETLRVENSMSYVVPFAKISVERG